jgi:predicted amidohydrolase YtcJ
MVRRRETQAPGPGGHADFVILDRSPLAAEPGRIADIRVLATVVGGQPAFQAAGSPLRV